MLALALIVAFTSPCFAILSPLNQSAEEIRFILESHEFQNSLPQGEAIETIERTKNGYLIKTQQRQLEVEIQYFPGQRPGRQPFKLNFQNPTLIHSS